MKPVLLDLFCGAGGAAMGYYEAGFEVVGIDIKHQRNYPFRFIEGDVLDLGLWPAFDAVHASPPCTEFTKAKRGRVGHTGWMENGSNLLRQTSIVLSALAAPHVIENVTDAPMPFNTWRGRLCGSMFGLDVRRHRWFTSNHDLGRTPKCDHASQAPRFRSLNTQRRHVLSPVVTVTGHINYDGELELRRRAMGIDWMTNPELVQAIPPAYTRWLGARLLEHLA